MKMNKIKKICLAISVTLSLLLVSGVSSAGEMDILLEKLVKKGVLTHGEAQEILTETKKEMRAEPAKGGVDTLPAWIQKTKIKGDLRLRYQYLDQDSDDVSARQRGRIRFRLGLESKVNEQWTVAAGLATGNGDPRSTDQTLEDTFSAKDIMLDYAYAQYSPSSWVALYGGKMKREPVLWEPTSLLWDNDINPEGAAASFSKDLNGGVGLFANTGFFILDEDKENSDEPWVAYLQPGLKWKINDRVSLKGAVTGYLISTGEHKMDYAGKSNTLDKSKNHEYDYDSISPALELSVKKPFNGILPYFSVSGEYVNALDPDDENNGFSVGFKLGEEKVEKFGQWQVKYIYRELERDAWFDGFPDSNAYGGKTNTEGHEIALTYGIGKNVTFDLDYFHMEPIDNIADMSTDKKEDLVQADIVMKF